MLSTTRFLKSALSISTIAFRQNKSRAVTSVLSKTMAATMASTADRVPFTSLKGVLKPELLNGLKNMGLTHMSPVQEKVLGLPDLTTDCLVQAKTGTGKTVAFLLPALQNLLSVKNLDRSQVGLLVMAPTRELAQQIADECDKLTSQVSPKLECHIAVGGSSRATHLNRFLKGKPTILVATPGRLLDYFSEEAPRAKLNNIRCLVLDEADRMLDAGFSRDIQKILNSIPSKKTANWQGMCFSATMPKEIHQFLPLVLNKNHAHISTIDPNEVPTVESVPQTVIPAESVNDVLPILHSVISCERADNPNLKVICFSSTARHAALLYHLFGSTGRAAPPKLPIFQMHSRMTQPARTRTVEEFKAATTGIMFASDVVGRGMDFPDIGLVIQIGAPADKEQYVHRVGRTGRAGKLDGRAIMILTPEEMNFVKECPEFPIKNNGAYAHPKASTWPSENIIEDALARLPVEVKASAYSAYLGFTKGLMKRYRLTPETVVEKANELAASLGFDDGPPPLMQSTVSKMGLKGVPGLNIEGKGMVRGHAPTGRTGGGRDHHGRKPDPRVQGRKPEGSGWSGGFNTASPRAQQQPFNKGGRQRFEPRVANAQASFYSTSSSSKPRAPRESLGSNAAEEPRRKKPKRVGSEE
ncbi:putative ATP-dependent RNA helicase MSS116 mitochondrial precursor [Podospora fimiseda]|uniref:ATP-dependent RNA helicase n=1 Tax=Podospora fimiseda TaxID=252190 RepID=A0AAN7BEZ0_9PEZI|nr:putative ATP-dependent RNA helicase MSS116 mitochondrial precursor [Podospora fimiseda]